MARETTREISQPAHSHHHFASGAGRNKGRLKLVLALTALIFIVELVGSWLANSLTLFADSIHMLTDVFGEGMALLAIWFAERPATARKTYGYYRVEILTALANGVILLGLSAYIVYEAIQRFRQPEVVQSGLMLLVAAIGLSVNAVNIRLLMGAAKESLNMKGAFYEVVSDALGSGAALLAGLLMLLTGWYYADPIFSIAIALFILPRTWTLLREAVDVLLEATPARLNLQQMTQDIQQVSCVRTVHDLHAWTISSGVEALSAHILVDPRLSNYNAHQTLCTIRDLLHDKYGIDHATLQLEEESLQAQEGEM